MISTVILYAQHYTSVLQYANLVMGIVLLVGTTILLFRLAPAIARLLGKTGINVGTASHETD